MPDPRLIGAAEATAVVLAVAVPAGLVSGYFAGSVDAAVGVLADIASSIPAIIFLLVVITVFSGNQNAVFLAFGLLVSPGVIRVVRSVTLSVRQELFVDAAKVSGVRERRILVRHVLPLVIPPVIVQCTFIAAGAILIEAALGFLGLGPAPPAATWGELVGEASMELSRQPWLVVPSGGILVFAALALGLIGDAARDLSADRFVRRTARGPNPGRAAAEPRQTAAASEGGPPDPGALLSVRGLTASLPGAGVVVEAVSFDVQRGETLGLLGESGCGKTMTSLALIGLLPKGSQTSGGVWFEGVNLLGAGRRALAAMRGSKIAMISQEPMSALDPAFTVGSQLSEAVRTHDGVGRRAAGVRVAELLDMVGLSATGSVQRLYPHELSGGMAQRVMIAIALSGRPRLLIADEPTTALDVTVQSEILMLLRDLQRQTEMAVLLITHDWGVVAASCQQVIVMYAGHIVESATVDALFERPLNPYTEALLASNPEHADPRQKLPVIPGSVPGPGQWPAGCRFAPRCRYASEECTKAPIALLEAQSGHLSRCIRVNELLTAGQG